jgi:CrcB protein
LYRPSGRLAVPATRLADIGYDPGVSYVLIAFGGAIGAVSRALVGQFVYRLASPAFPWGTFAVNVTGCLVFGLVIGASESRLDLGPGMRAFVLIGVLGGYTTFSSFTFETFELVREGRVGAAMFNSLRQVVLGLSAFWAAWAIARMMAVPRP